MRLKRGRRRILVISDLQCPFAHKDAFDFLAEIKRRFRTDLTVCIGDSLDFHAISNYQQDPDGMGPMDEYKAGIEQLKQLYSIVHDEEVVYECESNHNARPFRKAFGAGIPSSMMRTYKEIMQYPDNWRMVDHVEVDGVWLDHGDRGAGGINAARNQAILNRKSTVIGHFHSNSSITYIANDSDTIFGMCVGALIDHSAYAFKYAKGSKLKTVLSTGVVINGVPHIVPMFTDKHGRWTGKL